MNNQSKTVRLSLGIRGDDEIYAKSLPRDSDECRWNNENQVAWKFTPIGYGFQLSDNGHDESMESVFTVLMSSGQHGRTEVVIMLTGVDGTMKTIAKGSIPFSDDSEEDGLCSRLLRWVESAINREFDEWAKSRAQTRAALAKLATPARKSSAITWRGKRGATDLGNGWVYYFDGSAGEFYARANKEDVVAFVEMDDGSLKAPFATAIENYGDLNYYAPGADYPTGTVNMKTFAAEVREESGDVVSDGDEMMLAALSHIAAGLDNL